MANDGTVKIGTELDDSGFKSGLSKLSGLAGGALKGITAALAASVAAVGKLSKASLDAYSSYEQLVGGVETLFKNSASTVMNYANNAYKTAGISANSYMEQATSFSASLIQSLGGDTAAAAEYANQAIMDMSDNANKMGTDIETLQQTYQSLMRGNYAMLDNLKLGYGGTKAELERLVADAEVLTGQALDPNNFADVITAINAVQTELGITGTTALEASTTIEGSVNAMKAAWKNLLVGIAGGGEELDTLINNFVETTSTAAENIIPRLLTILEGFGTLITELSPVIAETLPTLIDSLLPSLLSAGTNLLAAIVNGIVQSLPALSGALLQTAGQILLTIGSGIATNLPLLLEQIPVMITSIVEYLTANLPVFLEQGVQIITNIVNGIISAIPLLLEQLPTIISSIADFLTSSIPALLEQGVNIVLSIVDGIVSAIPQIVSALPAIIESIVSFISSNLPTIVEQGIQILVSLVTGIINAIPQLIAALPQIITTIVTTLISNLPQIISAGIQILVALITGIIQAIPQLVAALPQIIAAIVNGLGALIGQVVSVGRNIVQGIWNGISGAAGWLLGKIRGWCGSILNGIKSFFGIASPSKVFRDQVGYNIGLGVAKGIDLSKDEAAKAADDLAKEVYNTSKEWLDKQVKYYEYGLREQLDVWTAIQSQFVKESQQWADAEEQIQDIRYNIMQENIALEEEYQKALEDRANEIFKTYKLFEQVPEIEEVSGEQLVKNLEGQVASIDNFYSKLDELSQRAGVGETLLNEIRDMGPDAIGELDALLALSDEKLQEYADLYQQKQELAKKYAMEELADMREQTDEEIQKNVDSLNGIYRDEAPGIGQTLAEGIAQGIIDNIPDIVGAAKDAAKSAAQAAKNEIAAMLPTASRAVFTTNSSITPASARSPSFAMENSIANAAGMIAMSNTAGSNRDIVLNLNGIEVARGILPDLRAVQSQSPAIVSDKR